MQSYRKNNLRPCGEELRTSPVSKRGLLGPEGESFRALHQGAVDAERGELSLHEAVALESFHDFRISVWVRGFIVCVRLQPF